MEHPAHVWTVCLSVCAAESCERRRLIALLFSGSQYYFHRILCGPSCTVLRQLSFFIPPSVDLGLYFASTSQYARYWRVCAHKKHLSEPPNVSSVSLQLKNCSTACRVQVCILWCLLSFFASLHWENLVVVCSPATFGSISRAPNGLFWPA